MVVRSDPAKLAPNVGPGTLPYPLLCDADGVLYDYLNIPVRSGFWRTCSLEAWRILKKARNRGYEVSMNAPPADAADPDPGRRGQGVVLPLRHQPDRRARRLRGHAGAAGRAGPAGGGRRDRGGGRVCLRRAARPPRRPLDEEEGDGYDDAEADADFDLEEDGEEPDEDSEEPEEPAEETDQYSPRLSQTFLRGILDDPYDD